MVQNFYAYAETQFGKRIKKVQSDNGTEFLRFSSFFKSKGIIHQTPCVGTPQQNGRVGRKHRHLLNVARSLMFQAMMPIKFWGEAVLTAAHVINLTPTRVLNGKCPHEMLFGSTPSYSKLRVFGSLCFAHKQLRDKNKFVPRSRRCVFVGYPFGKKGWKLYDLETCEFFVSRDVIFREEEFPFSETVADKSPLAHLEIFSDEFVSNEVEIINGRGSSCDQPDSSKEILASQDPAIIEVGPEVPSVVETERSEIPQEVSSSLAPETENTLGRGQRVKKPSVKLNDYVTYKAVCDNSTPHVLAGQSFSVFFDPVSGNTLIPLTEYI